jgi:hypothetical protein
MHQMLSAKGDPTMDNLAVIFGVLQQELQVELQVESVNQSLPGLTRLKPTKGISSGLN